MLNKTLLGSAAVIMTMVGAQAADLPSKKAAPATYVKICDAYGAGFFYVPGTDSCLKVGGLARVEYDQRGQTTGSVESRSSTTATAAAANTSGFYNRGVVQLDSRTPTSMGVVRAYVAARVQSGSGTMAVNAKESAAAIDAAFVQFAGFTFGQGAQPFSFMSSWTYMSNYWTGWPSGVRQLSYTAVLGGGLSATVSVQDGESYGYTTTTGAVVSSTGTATATKAVTQSWSDNGPIYVGSVRWDQSWGSVQGMGSYSGKQSNALSSIGNDGYAVGGGISFKLPMLGAGDSIELTSVYWKGMPKFGVGNDDLKTPSSGSWGPVAPLQAIDIATSTGWSVGAQFQHFFNAQWRGVLTGSYAAVEASSTTDATAGSASATLIWSPVNNFDIGLQTMYIRNDKTVSGVKTSDNNYANKIRVERRF